jgi:hypothetical protein
MQFESVGSSKALQIGLIIALSFVTGLLLAYSFFSDNSTTTVEKCKSILSHHLSPHRSFIGCMVCSAETRSHKSYESYSIPNSKTSLRTNSSNENQIAFDRIYSDQTWTALGGGSGVGSDPDFAQGAGHILQLVVYKYGISSLLDAPCGAVSNSWTRLALQRIRNDIPCFRYHGVDVAKSIVQRNIANFSNENPWATFSTVDLSTATLSKSSLIPKGFDMILSRDALQHLPYRGIAGAFKAYCESKSSYLLVTSYLDEGIYKNEDIASAGGTFTINLRSPPFSFEDPLDIYTEKGKNLPGTQGDIYPRKSLLVYKLNSLCKSSGLLAFVSKYEQLQKE